METKQVRNFCCTKAVRLKLTLFWTIDVLLGNQIVVRTGLKCFIITLIMALIKSKKMSSLNFRTKSLPAELLDRISRKLSSNSQVDNNRVLFVPDEQNSKLKLVNFQWVSLEAFPKTDKVFPCQILVIPVSETRAFADITKDFIDESKVMFYMTPTGMHNLRTTLGISVFKKGESIYQIRPIMRKDNTLNSFCVSVVSPKSARLCKLKGTGKILIPKIMDEYLQSYFQEMKYVAEGDLITLPCSDGMEVPLCFQVSCIETMEDGLLVKPLDLFSISTASCSVYLHEKEYNCCRPMCEHLVITDGEILHVVPMCIPFLQPYLNSLKDWLQSLHNVRSSLLQKSENAKTVMEFQDKNNELWPTCLLTGVVGSGKYTLASTLAVQQGFNFYCVNSVGLIGDTSAFTIAKLSAVVQKARTYSPCILYIKNIHLLGKDKEGQEDKRVILAFIDMLNEINGLYGTESDSEIYFIGETNKVEEMLGAVSDCFIFKTNINAMKNSEDIIQYFRWQLLRQPKIKFDFDIENWIVSNNVKVTLKYRGDLRALLTIATRLSYSTHLNKSLEVCEEKSSILDENLTNRKNKCGDLPFVVNQWHLQEALEKLEATERASVGSPKVPLVTWDDVGGLADTKNELINSIQLPLRFPHLFRSGIKRSGILLYGPPGTGKTLLAKAVASEFKINFFSVKGPELLNMYVGQSEQNVREVFDKARDCSPCVLFFDELDSLAPNRGRSGDSGGVMDRVVSQILAEMDGTHSSSNVFIIAATNRPDLIDTALLRPGRFDKLIYVGISSDAAAVGGVLKALTRKFNLGHDVDIGEISKDLPKGMSGADLYAFCSDSYMTAITRRIQLLESGQSEDQGSPVIVERKDFNEVLRRITPSLSTQELEKYEKLKTLIR